MNKEDFLHEQIKRLEEQVDILQLTIKQLRENKTACHKYESPFAGKISYEDMVKQFSQPGGFITATQATLGPTLPPDKESLEEFKRTYHNYL